MSVTPDHGYKGERLHLVVDGLRQDLGPRPTVFFSLPHLILLRQEITIEPGSIRETGPGKYEFDIAIDAGAMGRDWTVVVTRDLGTSATAGTFTVRNAYRSPGWFSHIRTLSLALPAPASPTPAASPAATTAAPMPASASATDPLQRILDAEADILAAIGRVAPDHVHCAKWLKAASRKEAAAAKVIAAVKGLKR